MKIKAASIMMILLLLCTACAGSDLNSDDSSVLSESSEAATYESVTEDTTDGESQPADGIVQVDWEHTKVYTWKAFTRNGRIDDKADWTTEDVFNMYGTFTITLADFPDTEFIWRDSCLFVNENGEESRLEGCNGILNAFFTDLNADGFPELCAFVVTGSGNGIHYVFVYDHHNQKKYTLQDWEEFNYALYAEEDTLYVRKTPYHPDSGAETTVGQLAIKNSTLIMTGETADNASQSAADIVQVDWEHMKVYTWKDFTIQGRKEMPDWLEDENELRGPFTIALAEFPDTVFMWWAGRLSTYENGEETVLVYLSSLWNAFFTDLNADGFPELCVSFSGGSSTTVDYIAVYDYHNHTEYTLMDFEKYNYSLYAEDDVLYVRKTPHPSKYDEYGTKSTIGKLAIENDALVMTEEMTEVIDAPPADEIVEVDWEHTKVYTWKDFTLHGDDEMPVWIDEDGNGLGIAFVLTDFPDTVFVWRHHTISAYENGERLGLVYGGILWNAFFTDLNADGFPELCATVSRASSGSGASDNHIVVYDYHNRTEYLLWQSTVSYALYAEDDVLYYSYEDGTESSTGQLAIENDALVMKE